jgi:hypothetical protein
MNDDRREWCCLEWIFVGGTIAGIILVIAYTLTVNR